MTCPNCGTDCDGDVCGDCGCFPVAPTLDTERHLGGPDDNHYARLGKYQPLEIVASWSEHWQKRYIYPLGESIYMISRFSGKNHGDKEQSIRDMRKLAFFADWIADDLEELGKTKP